MDGDALAGWLRARGVSEDLAAYAEPFGADVASFWAACPRGDWLLAVAARSGVAPAELGRAARSVVALGVDLLAEDDEAGGWLGDDAPEPERLLRAEGLEARSAAVEDGALATYLLAIAAALRATTLPEFAAHAAALTTQALVLDAGECAVASVTGWAQAEGANRVRATLGPPTLR